VVRIVDGKLLATTDLVFTFNVVKIPVTEEAVVAAPPVDEIRVESGAPTDNSAASMKVTDLPESVTAENIDQFASKLEEANESLPPGSQFSGPSVVLPQTEKERFAEKDFRIEVAATEMKP